MILINEVQFSWNAARCREQFINLQFQAWALCCTIHFNKLNSNTIAINLEMPDLKLKSYEGSDAGNGPKTE